MADNTTLNVGAGGDTVRDIARLAGTVKTQVVQLDLGGSAANAEVLITAGQHAMSTSVPVVIASDQSAVPVQELPARDSWGQALAVVANATATVTSATATAGYRIRGMVCHGTGDGYFALQVAGTTVLSGRIRATVPVLIISLPNGITPSANSNVAIAVTNESGSTADYEATLFGE